MFTRIAAANDYDKKRDDSKKVVEDMLKKAVLFDVKVTDFVPINEAYELEISYRLLKNGNFHTVSFEGKFSKNLCYTSSRDDVANTIQYVLNDQVVNKLRQIWAA